MTDHNPQQKPADNPRSPGIWGIHVPLENEICYFGLASADFFVTYILLSFDQFRESNQIAQFVLDNFGQTGMAVFKVAIVLFVVVIALVVEHRRKNSGRYLLIFGTIVVGCVVIYGVSLYFRYSGLF